MARKVFVSFRFSDGHSYKDYLCELFKNSENIIDCSEDTDRSNMSESTIQSYLYKKLRNTSITIVILTPKAINYHMDIYGNIDDWLYDEVRYSLEDRENNGRNGLVAVYTSEAEKILFSTYYNSKIVNEFNNLVRKNMYNIKPNYSSKNNLGMNSYCSLVSWEDFTSNPDFYINQAFQKREKANQYNIVTRMNFNDRVW